MPGSSQAVSIYCSSYKASTMAATLLVQQMEHRTSTRIDCNGDKAQLLSHCSKTCISLADPSASTATFKCTHFTVFIYFFIPVPFRSYFTCRTPDKIPKDEVTSIFFLFKSHNPKTPTSSVVNIFVHAVRKRMKKWITWVSLDRLPRFNRNIIALV